MKHETQNTQQLDRACETRVLVSPVDADSESQTRGRMSPTKTPNLESQDAETRDMSPVT